MRAPFLSLVLGLAVLGWQGVGAAQVRAQSPEALQRAETLAVDWHGGRGWGGGWRGATRWYGPGWGSSFYYNPGHYGYPYANYAFSPGYSSYYYSPGFSAFPGYSSYYYSYPGGYASYYASPFAYRAWRWRY